MNAYINGYIKEIFACMVTLYSGINVRRINHYLTGILISLFFSVCQAESFTSDEPYSFIANNTPLSEVLINFAANNDIETEISPDIKGFVNDHLSADTATEFLEKLSRLYRLETYFYNNTLYVSKKSSNQTRTIGLKYLTAGDAATLLRDTGIADSHRKITINSPRQLRLAGPPAYLTFAQQAIDARESELSEQHLSPVQTVTIIPLKYSSAIDRIIKYRDSQITAPGVATILSRILSGPVNLPGYKSPEGQNNYQGVINADPTLNAIILRDTPEKIALYKELISKLDIPTSRIEIALYIIDVDTQRAGALGIDWGGTISSGKTNISISSALSPQGAAAGTLLNQTGLNQLLANVHLLQTKGYARMVSRPTILTLENSPALIDHNETYYVKVNGERVAELKGITYGTLLQLTPRIIRETQNTLLDMTLHIEDGNQKAGNNNSDTIPTINRTVIDTIARVELDQSLLIGGIYRDEELKTESKVPLLGDIPWLGALFRSETTQERSAVRLFIIRPRIIDYGKPVSSS
ncbi:type III secretion system outer membrane ring subunit SctC [Morganella morganii]|uniref:type III secretion system outer membrane ring subunit SctC n=1 Tax=Morganella morganii TaxID=582 RepID=UPI00229B00CE|nr:EscC/YscC/HrcC family type III secretion system outer membrane ring protein [Morganella morganii]EGT3630526.1 EscC/YscC/HrcC family type III secretion system outer membrane ring protein [Morganella morganii]EGT3636006.1 EscC/YscC/HrcC family type III secretion system outer membrane ring protein [Morganella morganii]EJD6037679.1 type III secretion system outer membrane ring subunit SctC [Morganella morganii]HCT8189838.1 type III secretion system outer membrane ring subunit SctC [Morganella mo